MLLVQHKCLQAWNAGQCTLFIITAGCNLKPAPVQQQQGLCRKLHLLITSLISRRPASKVFAAVVVLIQLAVLHLLPVLHGAEAVADSLKMAPPAYSWSCVRLLMSMGTALVTVLGAMGLQCNRSSHSQE